MLQNKVIQYIIFSVITLKLIHMNSSILSISDRGQVTIPKKFREEVMVKRFVCHVENGSIILEPLKTRDEFIQDLEEAQKDYKIHGGKTLKQMQKEYNL